MTKQQQNDNQTHTVTVQLTVFAGDMTPEEVMAKTEQDLENLLDGTDYMNPIAISDERDEY